MINAIITPYLLATAILSAAPAQWTPFLSYMGTWDGKRSGGQGAVSVTRLYESVARNQHLLVTERVASERAPWGLVSYDDLSGNFVLRRFRPDGSVVELVLRQASKESGTLVFAGGPSPEAPGTERITQELHGANEFVERVEVAKEGQPLTVVSETVFRRKR
jgi:hypothetical protein